MVRKTPPIVVAITGIFVLLSIYGFYWMNKQMVTNSYQFLADLDYSTLSGKAIAASCAALFMYFLYMINYPEGQLARDAASAFRNPDGSKKES